MRTNIVVDDEIMRTAMEVSGIDTKRGGGVEEAPREFVAIAAKTPKPKILGAPA